MHRASGVAVVVVVVARFSLVRWQKHKITLHTRAINPSVFHPFVHTHPSAVSSTKQILYDVCVPSVFITVQPKLVHQQQRKKNLPNKIEWKKKDETNETNEWKGKNKHTVKHKRSSTKYLGCIQHQYTTTNKSFRSNWFGLVGTISSSLNIPSGMALR